MDSVLRFLADNLVGVPVHAMRFDKNNPASTVFQQNALNVDFLDMVFDTRPSTMTVSFDLIYDKELDAVDAAEKVMTLMNSAAYTPKLDYTNPLSPVAVNGWVYWGTNVRFRQIVADEYAHFNATLMLHHYHS
jgi:hypothetical protein